jgi:hypothetical protein
VLAANVAKHPIPDVPADVLVRLGLVETAGAPPPSINKGEADLDMPSETDTRGRPLPQQKKLIRRAVLTIHPSMNEPNFVKVSVNGRAIQIMCEKKVAIPWEHFLVLENAKAGIPRVTDGSVPAGLMEFDEMRRFNYTFHGEVWTDSEGKVVKRVAQQVEEVA